MLTRQAKDHLIAELAQRLGIFKLHQQAHRTQAALESLVKQLEAQGLASFVKTFRRPGLDPHLLKRLEQHLSLNGLLASSASTSAQRAATRRSSRRASKSTAGSSRLLGR